MGLQISSGRIVMTDAAGNVRFDTNEKNFLPLNYISGVLSFPTYACTNFGSGSETLIDQDNVYVVGSISANANTVRGAAKFSASFGGFNAAYTYNMSGSIVYAWGGGTFYSGPVTYCGHAVNTNSRVVTFFCDGGQLKVRDRVVGSADDPSCVGAGSNTLTMVGFDVEFAAFCGTFI